MIESGMQWALEFLQRTKEKPVTAVVVAFILGWVTYLLIVVEPTTKAIMLGWL